MSSIDKQALRKVAEKAGADEWRAFIDTKSKTYAVHTPGDNRCGDVVKWAGFDGQQKAANKAQFIAAANPATVLALLDELEVATDACNGWQKKFSEADERLEAAEKRIAELEAKQVKIKLPESFYPDGDIECPLVINEYQIIEAIVAADCKPIAVCPRCKCELDLSHKPDGAHYCHAAGTGQGE